MSACRLPNQIRSELPQSVFRLGFLGISCLHTFSLRLANSLGVDVRRLVPWRPMPFVPGVRQKAVWLLMIALGSVACGSDETMARRWEPAPDPQSTPGVDICGAVRSMLQAPGVVEGLCALQSPRSAGASGQCTLCAASGTLIQSLWPVRECSVELSDCPVESAELSACFATLGETLASQLPRCSNASDEQELDPTALALEIATSACAGVITQCPPLQRWVIDLVTSAAR